MRVSVVFCLVACVRALSKHRALLPVDFKKSSGKVGVGREQQQLVSNSTFQKSPIADELLLLSTDTDFSTRFLEVYWQKRPVLIRGYIPNVETSLNISASMLLRLAMDEDVESRIIVKMNNKWKKKAGPFRDVDLSNLQAKNWTLLVQEVDRHVPHIADLWAKHFNFIPTWRRDDVMVSYAREGGGIGAHVDNYDVFLVQGRGTRRWSIENSFLTDADELEREVPDVQTRLLTGFRCDQSWVLEPGDTLYLPPRVPHQGVSLDDNCITVSMGFRAPSYISLCSAYVEHVCSRLERSDMYQDPDLELQASVGAVASEAIESVLTSLQSKLMAGFEDADCWTDWLGKYLTLPLRNKPLPRPFFLAEDKDLEDGEDDQDDDEDPDPLYIRSREHSVASKRTFADVDEVIAEARAGRMTLRRAEGCRAVSIGSSLFIDGESFFCVPPADSAGLLQGLCDSNQVNHDALLTMLRSSESTELLRELLQRGYLYPVDLTY